jgi:hypothetical protein
MGDSYSHLTTTSSTGWPSLPTAYFDVRRELIEQFIAVRTGFWLSFFRFQGATTHATEVGGAKYTISGFLRRIRHRFNPATGMPTLPAKSPKTQVLGRSRYEQDDHASSSHDA